MFSTFTHPSLLKYGQSQGRASILIAILSFPSFRRLYIERSLYTEVQNEEPVAATGRPDSFVPLLPSMQKCTAVLCKVLAAHKAQSFTTLSIIQMEIHHKQRRCRWCLGFVHFFDKLILSLQSFGWAYPFPTLLADKGCWLCINVVRRILQKHHAVRSCGTLGLVFTSKWLVWGL